MENMLPVKNPKREDPFHILTLGWELQVIQRLADPLQKATGYRFSHIPDPSLDAKTLAKYRRSDLYPIHDRAPVKLPPADRKKLAALERDGVPTIHNMIMGDRVVKKLEYTDALAYASYLANRLEELFLEIKPSVIIGGFDSLHNAIGLAVARKMGIPCFTIFFATIPAGIAGFCTDMSPGTCFAFRKTPPEALRAMAEHTLSEFESKRLLVPAYLSANNLAMILKRFPLHVRSFFQAVGRLWIGRFDRFTQYPLGRLARDYVRKRKNLWTLPKKWLYTAPPDAPYFFMGLHMQPESSIDVWAPFFANQFAVIESIARAMPPTYELLIKLHKSDADAYSRRQLDEFRRLPGVRLVSPFVSSRGFIENASLVFSIQGYIALEAAMLGRPVLLFGENKFPEMPSVTKVRRMTDLPAQIRSKLSEEPPDREAIIGGLMRFLSAFAPGCYNDWDARLSPKEVEDLAEHLRALRSSLDSQPETAETFSVVDSASRT